MMEEGGDDVGEGQRAAEGDARGGVCDNIQKSDEIMNDGRTWTRRGEPDERRDVRHACVQTDVGVAVT